MSASKNKPAGGPLDPPSPRQPVDNLQKLKSEIGDILHKLHGCCLPDSSATTFTWPEERDFQRLNKIILKAVALIRPHHPLKCKKLWNDYKAVDHNWPGLNLCKRINNLVERSQKNSPINPLQSLLLLAKQKTEDGKLAAEFVDKLPGLFDDPRTCDWDRFTPIFLRVRNQSHALATKVKGTEGNPQLRSYTVGLEIIIEDIKWQRKHSDGAGALRDWISGLREPSLIRKLERFDFSFYTRPTEPERWEKMRLENKKNAARERQRRHRAKLSPQKA
jgi:hypothetical protein